MSSRGGRVEERRWSWNWGGLLRLVGHFGKTHLKHVLQDETRKRQKKNQRVRAVIQLRVHNTASQNPLDRNSTYTNSAIEGLRLLRVACAYVWEGSNAPRCRTFLLR